jgi:tRNA-Thr(GGU) m(6)t(6)A37 methyltransferase TsaA
MEPYVEVRRRVSPTQRGMVTDKTANNFILKPIGIIHSGFRTTEQIRSSQKVRGEIEVYPEYEPGLKDIDGFSHLFVIWGFHLSDEERLTAHPPYYPRQERGVFATRSPRRPNRLGLTVVRLLKREGRFLKVKGLDMAAGSPLFDLKPYTPKDQISEARFGWLDSVEGGETP